MALAAVGLGNVFTSSGLLKAASSGLGVLVVYYLFRPAGEILALTNRSVTPLNALDFFQTDSDSCNLPTGVNLPLHLQNHRLITSELMRLDEYDAETTDVFCSEEARLKYADLSVIAGHLEAPDEEESQEAVVACTTAEISWYLQGIQKLNVPELGISSPIGQKAIMLWKEVASALLPLNEESPEILRLIQKFSPNPLYSTKHATAFCFAKAAYISAFKYEANPSYEEHKEYRQSLGEAIELYTKASNILDGIELSKFNATEKKQILQDNESMAGNKRFASEVYQLFFPN